LAISEKHSENVEYVIGNSTD